MGPGIIKQLYQYSRFLSLVLGRVDFGFERL